MKSFYFEVTVAVLSRGIKLSELSSMSEDEKEAQINAMFRAVVTPTREQLIEQKKSIQEQISQFENCYNISSEQMKEHLKSGELSGDANICSWLMLLKIRDCSDFSDSESSRTQSVW